MLKDFTCTWCDRCLHPVPSVAGLFHDSEAHQQDDVHRWFSCLCTPACMAQTVPCSMHGTVCAMHDAGVAVGSGTASRLLRLLNKFFHVISEHKTPTALHNLEAVSCKVRRLALRGDDANARARYTRLLECAATLRSSGVDQRQALQRPHANTACPPQGALPAAQLSGPQSLQVSSCATSCSRSRIIMISEALACTALASLTPLVAHATVF